MQRNDIGSKRLTDGLTEGEPSRLEGALAYYRRLSRVRDYVLANYEDHITLEIAADIAGLERTSFSRFFRQKTGLCFTQWLRIVRVKRAKELLARRNRAVTEVAFAVGFRDLSTFERAFKRIEGVTPSCYKSRVRPR